MKINKKFTRENNIRFTSSDFDQCFGDIEFDEGEVLAFSKKLSKSMTDKEIQKEFNPSEVTLGEVFATLKELSKDTRTIFYVKDIAGVLRAVYVYWSGDGWDVFSYSIADTGGWHDGRQVFSRNSFDLEYFKPHKKTLGDSDTLTLESALKMVVDAGYTISKTNNN